MKNVQDIYPLSPMQQMMLLHAQSSYRGRDVLFNQVCYRLTGALDVDALRRAWVSVASRHQALRTSFISDGLPQPMQVVRKQAELPFHYIDQPLDAGETESNLLAALTEQDSAQGFDPAQAPLMRVTLARVDSRVHLMIWSSHHLIIDRWSTPTVLQEVTEAYQSLLDGRAVAATSAAQYSQYIRWLAQRSEADAQRYWRRLLAGSSRAARLTRRRESGPEAAASPRRAVMRLDGPQWQELREFCRQQRLTPAALLQGAWSLLLHSHSGAQDVMLGVVAAGRPAELRDVESIVGSFVTNLPVRILLPGDSSIGAWLAGIQQQSRARLPFEYVSLSQIQRWSGSAGHDSLFDTLMVWLNGSAAPVFSGLELELLSHGMGTVFPLSLYVDESSDCLELVAELGENHEAVTPLQELLAELGRFLSLLASSDQQATLATLPGFRGNRGAADLVPSAPPEVAVSEVVATAATEVVVGREQPERELLQELVAGHWCTILGLSEIPADGDFFELGGDSLKATSLAESLQQALGREIPVLAIFRRPTIAGMAEVILDRDWPSVARVAMPVRTGGSMPPLFCVASPEVDTVGYAVLARHLCAERPVYVLQSPPSAARVRRLQPPEIPVLAANYLAAIREIQPQGPYHLLGMCSGSQIEMEICRALAEQGDTIGFWGVLDTWALFTLSRRYYVKKMLDLGRYYLSRVRALRSMDGGRRAQAVQRVASRHLAGTGLAEEPAPASGAAESESRAYTLVEEIGWPHEQPDRPKIRSRVTVFRQRRRQQYWRVRDAALGWARHAESVEVVHLAAPSHKTIFKEPYTADLAHLIESRLSEH